MSVPLPTPPLRVATGSFTVDLHPIGEGQLIDGVTLGRMALEKVFQGDLIGRGSGEMLTALTSTPGSAGYVAMERVIGTLHGRGGGFMLQHWGSMRGGSHQLSITIVPDSGTGALRGINGTFKLRVENEVHFYDLEYSLPE